MCRTASIPARACTWVPTLSPGKPPMPASARSCASGWRRHRSPLTLQPRAEPPDMDLGLRDQVVVVTGASKGIGFACAQAFAREGARVALVSRSRANLDAALARIDGAAHRPASFVADLVDAA